MNAKRQIIARRVWVWFYGVRVTTNVYDIGGAPWAWIKESWRPVRPCEHDGQHAGDWAHDTRS